MQEFLTSVALVLLIATHYLLVRKCASLEASIPAKTATLESRITEVKELLDEALDLFADSPAANAMAAVPTMAESLPALLLSRLMGGIPMGSDHASTTQPQEWEVLEPNDPTTTQ